ncbi:MAG: response regulator [Pseudomonadota bacterium]
MDGCKGRILLLDREKTVQEATADVLEYIGYSVTCADNPREAFRIHYEARTCDSISFDAAIIDSEILKSKEDAATLSHIRQMDQGIKIIVSSAYPMPGAFANIQKLTIDGIIIKPYRIRSLEAVLKWLVTGRKAIRH